MAAIAAEFLFDLGLGALGIFDDVMQQRGRDRRPVELHFGKDSSNFEGMIEESLAGGALLSAMRAHGIDIGAIEQLFVGGGIIGHHPLNQFKLPHHSANEPFPNRT